MACATEAIGTVLYRISQRKAVRKRFGQIPADSGAFGRCQTPEGD
jgi:hypothetical protein